MYGTHGRGKGKTTCDYGLCRMLLRGELSKSGRGTKARQKKIAKPTFDVLGKIWRANLVTDTTVLSVDEDQHNGYVVFFVFFALGRAHPRE